jgi:hypothetical protein
MNTNMETDSHLYSPSIREAFNNFSIGIERTSILALICYFLMLNYETLKNWISSISCRVRVSDESSSPAAWIVISSVTFMAPIVSGLASVWQIWWGTVHRNREIPRIWVDLWWQSELDSNLCRSSSTRMWIPKCTLTSSLRVDEVGSQIQHSVKAIGIWSKMRPTVIQMLSCWIHCLKCFISITNSHLIRRTWTLFSIYEDTWHEDYNGAIFGRGRTILWDCSPIVCRWWKT